MEETYEPKRQFSLHTGKLAALDCLRIKNVRRNPPKAIKIQITHIRSMRIHTPIDVVIYRVYRGFRATAPGLLLECDGQGESPQDALATLEQVIKEQHDAFSGINKKTLEMLSAEQQNAQLVLEKYVGLKKVA